jgi:hypothetical protein
MDIIISRSATGHEMPAIVTPDGMERLLGRPASKVPLIRCSKPADPSMLLPQSQWVEFDRTRTVVPILDQGSVGSCTGHGGVEALMVARDIAGQSFNLLSASMVYAQVNGGADQGASLTDVVKALQTTGACLDSEMPEGFYTQRSLTSSILATAKRFMTPPSSWYTFSSFAEAGSLSQMGWQLYFSITAGAAWSNQSQYTKYWVPRFYRGAGNHAQSGGEKMTNEGGDWLVQVRQSWGTDVANAGFYNINAQFIDNQGQFEGYAVKFPSQDPQDPNIGPVATSN